MNDRLVPSASDPSSKVFFLKMKGDYHRYLGEFCDSGQKEKVAKDALEAYSKA